MLRVRDLVARKAESLHLEPLSGDVGLERPITSPEVSSPGLLLAGFTGRFPPERLQVLGQTEIAYLSSLSAEDRHQALARLLSYEVPCVFVTKGQEVPDELLTLSAERGISIVRTALGTGEFYRRIKPFLEEAFAEKTTLHASMADVYGVGLLVVGRSGIGKSECVLDLVERGHRLVADDVVHITRRGVDVLVARGHEFSHHYMEIRGLGLIDVRALFGIRAVRQQKRVEVVVQLADWDATDVDRTGLERREEEILGVQIPMVVVPLNPGKNLTVIAEVVAMNHLLRYYGIDSAQDFNDRLIERMREARRVREYLEEDYE